MGSDDTLPVAPVADTDTMFVYNIVRTHAALSPLVDRGLRGLRLTGAQMNALLVLRSAVPEGLPLGEIGRRLVVTKPNVTGLVDRLERQGLVTRDAANEKDRRVIRARLTDSGRALLEEALPRQRQVLADVLDCLALDEKRQLITLLTRLRRGMRENGRTDRPGDTD